jgi:hypothetical protein
MMPQFHRRLGRGAFVLMLSAGTLMCGCSTTRPSIVYLKDLQQTAIRGGFASGASVNVAAECPTCGPEETLLAENIVNAEEKFGAGCKGMPDAEASYRRVRSMMEPTNSIAEYRTYLAARMCQVADQYQGCTALPHRVVPIGSEATPAGALTGAIDQCRESNPAEADEILNRAIAQESESISHALMAGDFATAQREVGVYAALPRSNQQRADEWRNAIADEECAAKAVSARTSARVKRMVCDENYYVHNPDTGYLRTVGGMNMSHGGRIGPDNPFEAPAPNDTRESRMAVLTWELSSAEELSAIDAQRMLQSAYDRAAKDHSYCGSSN